MDSEEKKKKILAAFLGDLLKENLDVVTLKEILEESNRIITGMMINKKIYEDAIKTMLKGNDYEKVTYLMGEERNHLDYLERQLKK